MPPGGHKIKNDAVSEAYVVMPGPAGAKSKVAKCKRCLQVRAYNVSRMKEHLYDCKPYLTWVKSEGISNSITRDIENTEILASKKRKPAVGTLDGIFSRTLDSGSKHQLDKQFASALYTTNRPFNTLYQYADAGAHDRA